MRLALAEILHVACGHGWAEKKHQCQAVHSGEPGLVSCLFQTAPRILVQGWWEELLSGSAHMAQLEQRRLVLGSGLKSGKGSPASNGPWGSDQLCHVTLSPATVSFP